MGEDSEPADKDITFQPRPLERRGADQVNFYIGFLPVDSRSLSQTEFEVYLINDSNLYVRFLLLTQEGEQYSLRHEGLVLPNQNFCSTPSDMPTCLNGNVLPSNCWLTRRTSLSR